MPLRALLVAILILMFTPAQAATAARPRPVTPPALMTFYVAKGAPDACGRGCDRWIAVDGQVDGNAAARFRKFLSRVNDRNLPIYFSSPGGNLDQALAMGAMLRERAATARVARTVVRECGFEAQDSEVCLKLKASGRELHGDLFTRNAMCNSACPYLMLGATTREVAPDALLGVHSAKVVFRFNSGTPPPEMRAAATQRGLARVDSMLSRYLVKMGAEQGLLALASTIRFEDVHVLTREEIVRFGIDRRELVETPWTFENVGRSVVHKTVIRKNDGDKSYRTLQWRLICFNTDQFELDFQRPRAASSVLPTVAVSGGGAKPQYLMPASVKLSASDLWAMRMTRASIQALAEQTELDLIEASQTPDGRRVAQTAKFSSAGLATALDSLLASCPLAKTITVGARDNVAK